MTTTDFRILNEDNAAEQTDGKLAPARQGATPFWLWTSPVVLFLILAFVFPVAIVVATSIDPWGGAPFRYYADVIFGGLWSRIFLQTILMAAVTTMICLLLGYPFAYFCMRAPPRLRLALLALIGLPYFISALIRAYGWIIVLNDRGIVNSVLIEAGFIERPLPLLFTPFGLYVGMVHVMLPVMIFPIFNAMKNVDHRLMQASSGLGAGPFESFTLVFFPLTINGIKSGALLVFIISLGFYITPAMLGGLRHVMVVNLIYLQARQLGNWELASAASVCLLACVVLLSLVFHKAVGILSFFEHAAGDDQSKPVNRPGGISRVLGLISCMVRLRQRMLPARRRPAPWSSVAAALPSFGLSVGVFAIVAFLFLPVVVILIMSFNDGSFTRFPPTGYSLRWYKAFSSSSSWLNALSISLVVAFITTGLSVTMSFLAAYGIVRFKAAGRTPVMLLVISPLIVPPIIVAIGLYQVFAPLGLIGKLTGLVIAHLVGALPYAVILISAGLSRFDRQLERASFSLGASPWLTFRRILLPLIAPSVVSAGVFSFIHSFDEVVITSVVTGIRTETLPMRVWQNIQNEIDPILAAVAVITIAITLLLLIFGELFRRRGDRTAPSVSSI